LHSAIWGNIWDLNKALIVVEADESVRERRISMNLPIYGAASLQAETLFW
jgi:hypothetical protein